MRFKEAYGGWQERRLTQEEAARLLGVCERTFRRYPDFRNSRAILPNFDAIAHATTCFCCDLILYPFLIPLDSKPHLVVRRAKAPFLSGCESRPATVAPAGSSRSG